MTDTLESLLVAGPYAIPDPRPLGVNGFPCGEIPDDLKCPDCDGQLSGSHFHQFKQVGCFSCYFWLEHIKLDHGLWKNSHVIVNGVHYHITPDRSGRGGFGTGFGGAEFKIRWLDGRPDQITHNRWCQGAIPPRFRPFMPDNAVFVQRCYKRSPTETFKTCWLEKGHEGDCDFERPK